MREMKASGIEWCGNIPISWSSKHNKYVMSKKKVICPKYHCEKILSLTMKGVIERDLDAGGKMPSSFDGYQFVYPNNLLMCLFDYDVTPRCIGLVEQQGLVSPAYSQFVLNDGYYAPYYYYYYLLIDNTKELLHLAKNLRHSFTEEQLGNINVPVPPFEEQRKIVDFLDKKCAEIDALTADIQTQIETLEEYKKSVITEAVTKGLDPNVEMKDSGVEWIGKIPANWTVIKIKYLSNEVNQKRLMNTESMYSYLGLENLKSYSDEIIKTETDYDEGIQKFCHKGNVLFSKLRPYLAKVMICPYDTFATSEFLELSPSECVCDANYLKYSMLNSSFINEVNLSTYGAKMPRADASYIKNIKICITNLDEQHRIADFLDQKCSEIDQTISEKQQQLDTLAEYKKSLIYEYVTGKKEVA